MVCRPTFVLSVFFINLYKLLLIYTFLIVTPTCLFLAVLFRICFNNKNSVRMASGFFACNWAVRLNLVQRQITEDSFRYATAKALKDHDEENGKFHRTLEMFLKRNQTVRTVWKIVYIVEQWNTGLHPCIYVMKQTTSTILSYSVNYYAIFTSPASICCSQWSVTRGYRWQTTIYYTRLEFDIQLIVRPDKMLNKCIYHLIIV